MKRFVYIHLLFRFELEETWQLISSLTCLAYYVVFAIETRFGHMQATSVVQDCYSSRNDLPRSSLLLLSLENRRQSRNIATEREVDRNTLKFWQPLFQVFPSKQLLKNFLLRWWLFQVVFAIYTPLLDQNDNYTCCIHRKQVSKAWYRG